MPCKPSPKSLKQLSLESVVFNFETLCYGVPKGSKDLMQIIESDRYKLYSSPFSSWPANLLEDLSKAVYAKRAGLKHLLYQVIQPQITHYTILIHGSIHVAMDLVSKRCKDLNSLEMTYSINLPPMYYIDFFRHFHKLTKLNLFGSMVDDNAYSTIGQNCPNLVDLNAGKTWITDLGVERISFDENGTVLCPHLRVISLLETRVTPYGLALFLRSHPMSVKIEHNDTIGLFGYMKEDAKFNLTVLSWTHSEPALTRKVFHQSLESCQRVESVTVTNPGCLNSESLYKLMTLKHLTKLHLANCSNCNFNNNNFNQDSFNFFEGVEVILSECGRNLRKLVLENFSEVDVGSIGEKCPGLKHLALSGITVIRPVYQIKPDLFGNLTNFEIWTSKDFCSICSSVLKQLTIGSKMLTNILLQNVCSLSDKIFNEIIALNPMLQLTNVVFDQCHEITVS